MSLLHVPSNSESSRTQRPFLLTPLLLLITLILPLSAQAEGYDWHRELMRTEHPTCGGRCGIMLFGGREVDTGLEHIASTFDWWPPAWRYGHSNFIGVAGNYTLASFWKQRFLIEPELGIGKRFGDQHQWETWAAVYLRYTWFPWNDYLYTTFAINTGLSYASSISEDEVRRSGRNKGSRLMHYLGPEITFALPSDISKEIVIRLHHRSGAYGVVSKADGGAQYLTIGFRDRF